MIDTTERNTPGWWLSELANALTQEYNRITTLEGYMTGDAPLPEGARGFRAAYQDFQRKARTNFGELVVEAVNERMTPAGFRVGESDDLDAQANRIWSANELDTASADVHADMLAYGKGYAMVDSRGDVPVVTYEDPRYTITAHDPLLPSKVNAALKMWRDESAGKDYAYLYLPDRIYLAERPANRGPVMTPSVSGFEWSGAIESDGIPVVRFTNKGGVGEYEHHTDVLDRINYMILQRLVVTAMQAFKQRAVVGDLPETDEDGKPIPYSEIFQPGPGALWLLPENAQMWESSQTSIQELLTAVKDDIRELSASTRTPIAMLIPEGANQSAEGASFNREGLIFKVQDRIKRATYGWNQVMAKALGVDNADVHTLWLPPERLSLSEKADAASKLMQVVPFRTLAGDVLQFSPAEVERMEQERLADTLNLGLLGGGETTGA